jgi:hypothetical protein
VPRIKISMHIPNKTNWVTYILHYFIGR